MFYVTLQNKHSLTLPEAAGQYIYHPAVLVEVSFACWKTPTRQAVLSGQRFPADTDFLFL